MISRQHIISYLTAAPLLVVGALLLSCSDQERIVNPFVASGDQTPDTGLGTISGLVVNATGTALAGARLDVLSATEAGESATGFADLSGRFFLANLPLDRNVVRFSVAPQRFNTNYRRLQLSPGGELHFPRVMLLPVVRGSVFFANASGSASIGAFGSGATFADSSFVAPDSTIYVQRVAPYLAVTTFPDQHFAAAFPGEYLGTLTDGTEVALDALGVMWVFVDSQVGGLALAPGKDVTYRLGIDPTADGPPPENALVWLFDVGAGSWREIGESLLDNGVYTATVASLGPICWANPAAAVCEVLGVVHDDLGEPLGNANIDYRDLSGRFRGSALSEDDGSFSLTVVPSFRAVVTPYIGSVSGTRDTMNTLEECPSVIAEPLVVTLPHYRIDLDWQEPEGDLDAYGLVYIEEGDALKLQWTLSFIDRGRLDIAPYARHEGDARGTGPESIVGRRWYDGRFAYWVHDYRNERTDALRATGAVVDLTINERAWRFAVDEAAFDAALSDSSGWWHVFDIVVVGASVEVEPVQRFAPAPRRQSTLLKR